MPSETDIELSKLSILLLLLACRLDKLAVDRLPVRLRPLPLLALPGVPPPPAVPKGTLLVIFYSNRTRGKYTADVVSKPIFLFDNTKNITLQQNIKQVLVLTLS